MAEAKTGMKCSYSVAKKLSYIYNTLSYCG
jgi:hypothetical protein